MDYMRHIFLFLTIISIRLGVHLHCKRESGKCNVRFPIVFLLVYSYHKK